MSSPLFGRLSARLESARNDDGGFGPRPGLPSEPEPTALATLALDDDAGRAWLAGHQRPDGSLALVIGDRVNPPDESVNDSATSLAALALPAGAGREEGARSHPRPPSRAAQHVELRSCRWTQPTAGGAGRPSRSDGSSRRRATSSRSRSCVRPRPREITDAVRLLADRSCVGGGWNYGNREVWDKDLEPYAADDRDRAHRLQGAGDPKVVSDGYTVLRRLWPIETGGFSLGLSLDRGAPRRRRAPTPNAPTSRPRSRPVVRLDGVPRRQRRARMGDLADRRQPRRDQGAALMAVSRRTFLIRGAEVGLGVAAVGLVGARGASTSETTNPTLYDKGAFPDAGQPEGRGREGGELRRPTCRPRSRGARVGRCGRDWQDRAAEAEPGRVRRGHRDQHRSSARARDGARAARHGRRRR